METTAEETGGGYIINGSKTWITNAPFACVYSTHIPSDMTDYVQRCLYRLGQMQVGWEDSRIHP